MKNLKPGNCIAFGSAFKVPTVMYMDLPNPMPLSENVDLINVWYKDNAPKNLIQDTNNIQQQGVYITQDVNQIMIQQAAAVPTSPQTGTMPVAPQPTRGTYIQQSVQ